ncbi:MAG: hypothetical protein NT025_07095 [bacterium]|nr:hypothetical protein [bacterium]
MINTIEEIVSQHFPIAIAKLSTVVMVERQRDDTAQTAGSLHFMLGDTELGRLDVGIDFEDKLRCRLIMVVHALVVPMPGDLKAQFRVNGEVLGSWKMVAKQIGLPQAELFQATL